MSRSWFVDAFCGSGPVGQELVRLKQLVYFLDRVLGPRGDMCSRQTIQTIARDAGGKHILGSMLAPPCSSHSQMQNISSLGPLRTAEHPCGVPGLAGERLERVTLGNRTARACARVCRIYLEAGVPFIVENPARSYLWQQPGFQQLLKDKRVVYVEADQCLYGTLWRKRTGFLTGNISETLLEKLQCRCASRGGRCDRTTKRHVHLIGGAPGGGSMTSKAQNYPPSLARMLAGILLQAAADRSLSS